MTSGTMPRISSGTNADPSGDTASSPSGNAGAVEKVQGAGHSVGAKVSERVQEQVDQRSTEAGEHVNAIARALQNATDSLRTHGETTPASALSTVADQVEQLGSYLTRMDGNRVLQDLDHMARRRPWMVAATMFGVGVAASRIVGASSRSRYQARGELNRGALTRGGLTRSTAPGAALDTSGYASRPIRDIEGYRPDDASPPGMPDGVHGRGSNRGGRGDVRI